MNVRNSENLRERGGEMKTWYRMTAEEALRGMESSRGGLSSSQAEMRCSQFGENVLREHAGKKTWQVFLEQFQDLLVLILIAAAAISILSGSGESAAVIFAVITMNAILGTVQHEKARKSLESLKNLSAPAAQIRLIKGVVIVRAVHPDVSHIVISDIRVIIGHVKYAVLPEAFSPAVLTDECAVSGHRPGGSGGYCAAGCRKSGGSRWTAAGMPQSAGE